MKNSTLKQVFRLLASGRCRAGSSDARTLLHLPRPPFAFAQWAAVAQLPVSSSSSPRSRSRVHWSGRPGEETNTHKTVKRWPISVRVMMFYFHVPKFVLIFPMTSHPILLSYLFSINIRRAKSYYPFEDFFFFPHLMATTSQGNAWRNTATVHSMFAFTTILHALISLTIAMAGWSAHETAAWRASVTG